MLRFRDPLFKGPQKSFDDFSVGRGKNLANIFDRRHEHAGRPDRIHRLDLKGQDGKKLIPLGRPHLAAKHVQNQVPVFVVVRNWFTVRLCWKPTAAVLLVLLDIAVKVVVGFPVVDSATRICSKVLPAVELGYCFVRLGFFHRQPRSF